MSFKYESENERDNDKRSFRPDTAGDAARNVVSKDLGDKLDAIVIAVGGTVDCIRTIYNVTLGPANTEQSQVLPANVKGFVIKTRGQSSLKLSFNSGDSGTNYITIPKNAVYSEDKSSVSLTLYFQSPQTGDVVEIVAYS